jgi:hypothetical protein
VRRKRVKGKLEVAKVGETNDVRGQAQVKAQISELAIFLRRVERFGGGVGQGAWYGSSKKRRTFGQVIVLGGSVRGVGYEHVSQCASSMVSGQRTLFGRVHFGLLRLRLLDSVEEFGVQALGASLLYGPKYSSAQLGAVRLFAASPRAFCHGGGEIDV